MKRYFRCSIFCTYTRGLLQLIEPDEDVYIDEWKHIYDGEPNCGWETIFECVLSDFIRYAYSENSSDDWGATICERYLSGDMSASDVLESFDNFVNQTDLSEYDV